MKGFCERPEETLKRELMEEVGIDIQKYELEVFF